jgi:tellurite resistance protein
MTLSGAVAIAKPCLNPREVPRHSAPLRRGSKPDFYPGLANRSRASTIGARRSAKEQDVANPPTDADWILKAMVAMAAADGRLDAREVGLIQKVYQDQLGRLADAGGVARAAQAYATRRDLLAEFSAAAGGMSRETKEEIIRAAYLVLLADARIAGEERKKLQDIAAALKISEIHFGAILEDLAIWLAQQKS